MGEVACMLCKSIMSGIKVNIDENYTNYSKLLLRVFLESVFEHKIILNAGLCVCNVCNNLVNELDLAESAYKSLRQKVLQYLDCSICTSTKANAYCQTDIFKENVLEYDMRGNKNYSEEMKNKKQDGYMCNFVKNENINDENNSIPKKHECHICFKQFISKNGAAAHIRKQHGNVDSKWCNIPGNSKEAIISLNSLTESDVYNQRPDTTNKIIQCKDNKYEKDVDNENKIEVRNLYKGNRGRKKKHPGILKPYQCKTCSKTWKTLGELKSHLSAHSDIRPYICEICGRAYKHKSALDIHLGMHNGIYPFRCTYCKKSFTQKGALQRHMPIHTGETPYQCDVCGKRFVHHTSFNSHQLSHSGQKDYKCAQCGLALLSGSHLKRHMRVHTGERNYACNLCDKRFAERYNLASHQKLHEKPSSANEFKRNHRCQICGIVYNRKLKLNEHITKDHQGIVETNLSYTK